MKRKLTKMDLKALEVWERKADPNYYTPEYWSRSKSSAAGWLYDDGHKMAPVPHESMAEVRRLKMQTKALSWFRSAVGLGGGK